MNLAEQLAQTLRSRGYDTLTTFSRSTSSAYVVAGHKNEIGGIKSVLEVRFSNHSKCGWRAGYIKALNAFHVRYDRAAWQVESQINKALAMLPAVDGKVGQEVVLKD